MFFDVHVLVMVFLPRQNSLPAKTWYRRVNFLRLALKDSDHCKTHQTGQDDSARQFPLRVNNPDLTATKS